MIDFSPAVLLLSMKVFLENSLRVPPDFVGYDLLMNFI